MCQDLATSLWPVIIDPVVEVVIHQVVGAVDQACGNKKVFLATSVASSLGQRDHHCTRLVPEGRQEAIKIRTKAF